MTPFRLHDSMRREKVPFHPIEPGKIGMYLCGPTTYAPAHIGHAFSAISFDTVRRSLGFLGWNVRFVRNVTDVDDKIIKRANETGQDPFVMSAHFAAEYNRDMARFNVLPPDVEPKVTGHIPDIIQIIERLIANGKAYEVDGDVYYEVATFPPYGRLSGKNLEDLRAGERIAIDERKRSPPDFALWKSAKPGEPSWDSPWGKGRPGWHIECSAMTVKHLGPTFDLHAGGQDLIFPHHENEIAQSQGVTGEGTFAHYWMHNGFLNFSGEKMSKSLGNVFNCDQIADAVGGEALRFFCVQHRYSSGVDFDVEVIESSVRFRSLEEADRRLSKFYKTLQRIDQFVGGEGAGEGGERAGEGAVVAGADTLVATTREALADDFNTPVVVAAMGEAMKLANHLLDEGKGIDKQVRRRSLARIGRELRAVGEALGILLGSPQTYATERRDRLVRANGIDVAVVQAKLAERSAARVAKDFARGDAIRGELKALGVELLDTPGGTDWQVLD